MCDKQRLNLYRVSRLLLEASTDTLRYFFEKLYSPQGDLQSFLKINRKKIKRLYRHNYITSEQKELLKPSNGTLPLLSELDITLLCILLKNLCHHQVGIPQCGWAGEPDDKDLSTGADILRLRKTRNKLYAHRTNAMMTDSDFQETWGKTCGVISRLSSHLDQKLQEDIQSNIEEISKAQVDPETMCKLFGFIFKEIVFKLLDRIGPQPDHTAPENAYHDGDEEAETEMPKGYDSIICLIKLYPELKSNMTRPSLTAIAKRLLDKNMISEDEYEQLKDTAKPRRCLTDMLLKKILRLDPEKTELLKFVFNRLRSHHPAIATKISQIVVTEADRTAFRQVKQYGLVGKNAHVTSPNSYKMTDAEILFFERSLCENQECVDRINDELLSQFLISISDHSLINQSDKKISALFKMVQLHSLDVESVLEHILEQSMLEQWKMLRCVVPVRAEIPNPFSTPENTVVHIETAMGDAKDDDKMTNFCRFFLLVMDPGKLTLQSFLEKKYSAIGDLQQFLKSKEGELNILCSKCIIKQWQLDILLPATRDVPAVQNLDISTICILLIYLCQITKPLNGWKELPSDTDLSIGADILRLLHTTENLKFYRMAGGMNALEFNEKWDNIHGAISRLSDQLDEKAIDIKSRMSLIREKSIDPGKERKINDEIFKRFLTPLGKNEEIKLGEIITMDVDEVCSDQPNQGYFRSLLGWMRYATNAVNIGFARQFRSDLKAVEKGSIVIKLLVWRELKVELLTKDFVEKNLRRLIKKGCVESKVKLRGPVHVTVYILSPEAQGEKEEIHFHLELESIKHDVKKPRVHLKSQDMKLMVEEMDPIGLQSWIFNQLQIDVTKQKIMNEIVSWQDLSRCDQMEILLDSIKRLENGFDMLAQYCKENDPYVYNKVFEKPEQASPEESDINPKAVWSSYRKGGGLQKLYSMQLDLDVEEQGKLHQTVLNRCLPELMEALDVKLACMFFMQKKLFDDVTMYHILKQKTISDRIMELIRLIQQREQDTYEKFKECLVLAKQSDLKRLLEKEEAQVSKEMKETHEAQGTGKLHKTVLNRCLPELMKDLDMSYVFVHIMDKELFDDVTLCDILKQKTISDRIMELIRLIQQREQDTYEKFKECLVLAKQSDLKRLLEKEEAQVSKEMKETHEAQGTGKLHQTVLNRCLPELMKDLDVRDVCWLMKHKGQFDNVTMHNILKQKTISDMIMELIRLIQQRDQDTYEEFKECLVLAKQSDLKHLLEKEEEQVSKEMKETHEAQGTGKLHQCVLNRCLPELKITLDVEAVCVFIQEKEMFDDVTIHNILKQKTISDMIMELIRLIQQRDQDTYEEFKECLVLAKQSDLKHLLEKEEEQVSKEMKETHEAHGTDSDGPLATAQLVTPSDSHA